MSEESFQEKTEQPTPKRREEARKKGRVAKSKEVVSVAVLSTGVGVLFFYAGRLTASLSEIMRTSFSSIPRFGSNDQDLLDWATESVVDYLWLILPMMAVLFVAALLANLLQTGAVWSVETLAPKASKISPMQGLKRILSKQSLVELAKSLAKVFVVGWAAFSVLKSDFKHLIPLMYQDKFQIIDLFGRLSLKVVVRCCWVIAVLAALDYLYQKWEFEQKLKMTKQEIKDEHKQTEGDPLVKSRIKSIQREMARRRMMEEVPKADVVIANPVHLAVVLRYDPEKMSAPIVSAKGAEKIAVRIKAVAVEHGVPVIENRPLAQNLYKVEIGKEIPSRLYQAIAEVLAYVYSLKRKRGAS